MFHNICDFIKDELKEIDRKIGSGSTLTSQELQYMDVLSHIKKSLLTIDAMENPEDYGYGDSGNGRVYMAGRGRFAKRDGMGRYASSRSYRDGDMRDGLYELMDKAPNEHVRRKLEELVSEMDK